MKIKIRTSASIKSLMKIKDVTEEDGKAIRNVWFNERSRHTARLAIDRILRTFGVEYLGIHRRYNEHVYYCNAGDSYACTIVFIGPRIKVACWGDMIENNLIKPDDQY